MTRKQKDQSLVNSSKRKLRTASDVISRLRWSGDDTNGIRTSGSIMIGYDDRIHGPMEKPLEDYVRIDKGGDIPEHRIQYFCERRDNREQPVILWDRLGRVDRVFGSGNGADAPVDPRTYRMLEQALSNMVRLEEEKQARRAEREKQRARRAKRRLPPSSTSIARDKTTVNTRQDRYSWIPSDWYTFSAELSEWTEGASTTWESSRLARDEKASKSTHELVVVTWNVLFNLYDDAEIELEQDAEIFGCDQATMERWKLLSACLEQTDADVIALQEVTPTFAELLLSQNWVQSEFATSATGTFASSVDPCGNLLLWRRNRLRVFDTESTRGSHLSICQDGARKRAAVAALELVDDPSTVLLLANVHLPADKHVGERNDCRALARQRELGAVVGRLQIMEQQMLTDQRFNHTCKAVSLIPMIVGDFNTDDVLLDDYFGDTWSSISSSNNDERCFTFDPITNERAEKSQQLAQSTKGPRTIDRVLVGTGVDGRLLLRPINGQLVGVFDGSDVLVPPSDHYGLKMSFCTSQQNRPEAISLSHSVNGRCAWASNAAPTCDTLLALVLDDNAVGDTLLFDPRSSLPVPHVTLMHGFVELDSIQNRNLATLAVEKAVQHIFNGNLIAKGVSSMLSLQFTRESFSVFEHRNSSTLVCLPDTDCDEGRWLLRLYDSLQSIFACCREQNDRFDGWTPHLSLGTYGSSASARSEINRIRYQWVGVDSFTIPTSAIGLYQRDPTDGKFYSVSTVPLTPRQQNVFRCSGSHFAADAGLRWSLYMHGLSAPVLEDLRRTCQQVIDESGKKLNVSIQAFGSYALDASLPNMSDVDAVILVRPLQRNLAAHRFGRPSELFPELISRIKTRYSQAKARTRGSSGKGDLRVLTAKLWPRAPSIDLQLCWIGDSGDPISAESSEALLASLDTKHIVETAHACSKWIPDNLDAIGIFEGALRLVKLWANRRNVYGPGVGYVGGGCWAVLLARVMYDSLNNKALVLVTNSNAVASCLLASHFFVVGSKWERPYTITLPPTIMEESKHAVKFQHVNRAASATTKALARGTMAVFATERSGELARNTLPCTVHAVSEELKRAAGVVATVENIKKRFDIILRPFQGSEFLDMFSSIIAVEFTVPEVKPGNPSASDVKGHASVVFLSFVLALEQLMGDPSKVRPCAKPVRVEGRFLFLVGCNFSVSQQGLNAFCTQRSQTIQHDYDMFIHRNPEELSPSAEIKCCNRDGASAYMESFHLI